MNYIEIAAVATAAPSTGDSRDVTMPLIIGGVCLILLILTFVFKKKK